MAFLTNKYIPPSDVFKQKNRHTLGV